jgi:hypothetical protein
VLRALINKIPAKMRKSDDRVLKLHVGLGRWRVELPLGLRVVD